MSRSVDISDSVGSANFTCVVMNSDVSSSCHIVAVTVHAIYVTFKMALTCFATRVQQFQVEQNALCKPWLSI